MGNLRGQILTKIIPIPLGGADVLATLHHASFDDPWSQDSFEHFLQDSSTCGWLAVQDQGTATIPVGFILARVVLDEAEILTFAVNPSVRRQGIGRQLIEKLQNFLRQEKIHKLFLEVAVTNEGAIKLYTSLDFREVSMRQNYYTSPSSPPVSARIFVWEEK